MIRSIIETAADVIYYIANFLRKAGVAIVTIAAGVFIGSAPWFVLT